MKTELDTVRFTRKSVVGRVIVLVLVNQLYTVTSINTNIILFAFNVRPIYTVANPVLLLLHVGNMGS